MCWHLASTERVVISQLLRMALGDGVVLTREAQLDIFIPDLTEVDQLPESGFVPPCDREVQLSQPGDDHIAVALRSAICVVFKPIPIQVDNEL
jgi:hypothetical protein